MISWYPEIDGTDDVEDINDVDDEDIQYIYCIYSYDDYDCCEYDGMACSSWPEVFPLLFCVVIWVSIKHKTLAYCIPHICQECCFQYLFIWRNFRDAVFSICLLSDLLAGFQECCFQYLFFLRSIVFTIGFCWPSRLSIVFTFFSPFVGTFRKQRKLSKQYRFHIFVINPWKIG